jgi:hypothetical protein
MMMVLLLSIGMYITPPENPPRDGPASRRAQTRPHTTGAKIWHGCIERSYGLAKDVIRDIHDHPNSGGTEVINYGAERREIEIPMILSNDPDPIPSRAIRASYVTAFLILDGLGAASHHWPYYINKIIRVMN